jgi:hypothetical protein
MARGVLLALLALCVSSAFATVLFKEEFDGAFSADRRLGGHGSFEA